MPVVTICNFQVNIKGAVTDDRPPAIASPVDVEPSNAAKVSSGANRLVVEYEGKVMDVIVGMQIHSFPLSPVEL